MSRRRRVAARAGWQLGGVGAHAGAHARRLLGGGGALAGTRLGALAAVMTVAAMLLACGGSQASFDPGGPCETDGRTAGAYPELESRLPTVIADPSEPELEPVARTSVDSGRSCTPKALATLVEQGVSELRYAGATWDHGDGDASVSAIFVTPEGQPALQAAWMERFYEATARASTKTENIEVTRPSIGSTGTVFRLDTLNNLSLQTVVVFPSGDAVRAVIVATTVGPDASRDTHESRVELLVRASTLP